MLRRAVSEWLAATRGLTVLLEQVVVVDRFVHSTNLLSIRMLPRGSESAGLAAALDTLTDMPECGIPSTPGVNDCPLLGVVNGRLGDQLGSGAAISTASLSQPTRDIARQRCRPDHHDAGHGEHRLEREH